MIDKKREIYIKIENINKIIHTMYEIKQLEEQINSLFKKYDKLNYDENKIFESWGLSLETIGNKLDRLTL